MLGKQEHTAFAANQSLNRPAKLRGAVGVPRIAGEVGIFQRFRGGNSHEDNFLDGEALVIRRNSGE